MNFHCHNNWLLKTCQLFSIAKWYQFSRLALKAVYSSDPHIQSPVSKETTFLTGFFRIQEHILPMACPCLGPSHPRMSPSSFWLHPFPPAQPINLPSSQFFQPLQTSPLLPTQHRADSASRSCSRLLYSMGASGMSSLGLACRDYYFISVWFCWQHSDASHIQPEAWCAPHSALTRGVNSVMNKRLSFLSKCLHSENFRLQISSVNQQSWTLLKLAKVLFKLFFRRKSKFLNQPPKIQVSQDSFINQWIN